MKVSYGTRGPIKALILGALLASCARSTQPTSTHDPITPPESSSAVEANSTAAILLPTASLDSSPTPAVLLPTVSPEDSPKATATLTSAEQPPLPNGAYWMNTYHGPTSGAASIQQTRDGGFIVRTHSNHVLKLLPDGRIEWQKKINLLFGSQMFELDDGGFLVIDVDSTVRLQEDGTLDLITAYFREIEDSRWPDPPFNVVWSVETGPEGGVLALSNIALATTFDGQGNVSSQLAFDANPPVGSPATEDVGWTILNGILAGGHNVGESIWIEKRILGGPSWRAVVIAEAVPASSVPPEFIRGTKDGGVIFASNLYSVMYDGAPQTWLVRLNTAGELEWQRVYGMDPFNLRFHETEDGGFLLTALRYLELSEIADGRLPYLWVGRFDRMGEPIWARLYGDGATVPRVSIIHSTIDGGFLLAGNLGHYEGGEIESHGEMIILKLNSEGQIPGCELARNWTPDRSIVPPAQMVVDDTEPIQAMQASLIVGSEPPARINISESYLAANQLCVAEE